MFHSQSVHHSQIHFRTMLFSVDITGVMGTVNDAMYKQGMASGVKMEDSGLTQGKTRRVEFVQEVVCFGGTSCTQDIRT